MESTRALLDQLMGKDRDQVGSSRERTRHFTDPKVDKHYLVGCSPYELLRGTKSDLGENPCIPDEECKREWDELSDEEKRAYGYEEETRKFLQSLVAKCDRNVSRTRELVYARDRNVMEENAKKVVELEAQMEDASKQMETLATQGLVSRAFELYNRLETLASTRDSLLRIPDQQRQLLVCPVTAKKIARADNDQRLRCYFEGRQYTGWRTIRDTLEQLSRKPPLSSYSSSASHLRERDSHSRRRDRDKRDRRRRSRSHSRSRSSSSSSSRSEREERRRRRKEEDRRRRKRSRSRSRDRRSRSKESRRRKRSRSRSRDRRSKESRRRKRSRSRSRDRRSKESRSRRHRSSRY